MCHCYENPILIDDKHILCKNCGTIDGTRVGNEYADLYENRYKIRKKSIYRGKYLIKNTINDLVNVCRIDIPYELRQKVLKICQTIEPVIVQLNGNGKRMINSKYIISQVMKLANVSPAKIPITNSKKYFALK